MPLTVVVSFVVVFALSLLAVSVGLKYFDARRKNQVVDMLHTAAGEAVVSVGNLLKEIESDTPSGMKRLFASMHFSKHAEEMIQKAGLNWSSSRLLTAMVLMSGMAPPGKNPMSDVRVLSFECPGTGGTWS